MNFTELRPIIVASQDFDSGIGSPVPWDGGWIIAQPDPPSVILLDASLQVIRQFALPVATEDYVYTEVACSRDARFLAISARTRIEIFDSNGESLHTIAHEPWDSFEGSTCCFDADGKLWCVQPQKEEDGCDHLTIIDPESGEVVAEQAIRDEHGNPADVGHFSLYPCPNGVDMLLNLACGQDGSLLYLAHRTPQRLEVNAYPFDDRTFSGGFSPNGREFVTGAHQGDSVKVHAFPSSQVLASADSTMLFEGVESDYEEAEDDNYEVEEEEEETDHVGYQALYLNDAHLLVETGFGRLLLLDRQTMQPIGNVSLPDFPLQGYDEHGKETDDPDRAISYETGLSSIHPAGPNRVLAVYNARQFRLLGLASLS